MGTPCWRGPYGRVHGAVVPTLLSSKSSLRAPFLLPSEFSWTFSCRCVGAPCWRAPCYCVIVAVFSTLLSGGSALLAPLMPPCGPGRRVDLASASFIVMFFVLLIIVLYIMTGIFTNVEIEKLAIRDYFMLKFPQCILTSQNVCRPPSKAEPPGLGNSVLWCKVSRAYDPPVSMLVVLEKR